MTILCRVLMVYPKFIPNSFWNYTESCELVGANVDIYVGARILGGVSIGDRVMIGANCVVSRDVASDMVVMQAPVRGIPRSLSPHAHAQNAAAPAAVEVQPKGGELPKAAG